MDRAREGLLAGAVASVAARGVRATTVADIADAGGVARATLYNHFRTKDDVLAAAAEREALRVVAEVATRPDLPGALAAGFAAVAGHPAVRRLADSEPAALVPLLAQGGGPRWSAVRAAVAAGLRAHGARADAPAVDLVIRLALSQALDPGGPEVGPGAAVAADALRLAASDPATASGGASARAG
jgi:AcrR family transcriptional regulator